MKSFLLLPMLVLGIAFSANAQGINKGERGKRIEAFKIAFFTEELSLTSKEAEGFWPIYNAMRAELKQMKKDFKPSTKIEFMSDEEAELFIERRFLEEEKRMAIERKYVAEFKRVLPIKKVAFLPQVERKFRHKIVQHVRDRHQQSPPDED